MSGLNDALEDTMDEKIKTAKNSLTWVLIASNNRDFSHGPLGAGPMVTIFIFFGLKIVSNTCTQ